MFRSPPKKLQEWYAAHGQEGDSDQHLVVRHAGADNDDINAPGWGRRKKKMKKGSKHVSNRDKWGLDPEAEESRKRAARMNEPSPRFSAHDVHFQVLCDPKSHQRSAVDIKYRPHLIAFCFGTLEREHVVKYYRLNGDGASSNSVPKLVQSIAVADITAVRRDLLDTSSAPQYSKFIITFVGSEGFEIELAHYVLSAHDRDLLWQLCYSITVGDAPLAARHYGFPELPMVRRGMCKRRGKGKLGRNATRFLVLAPRRLVLYGYAPKSGQEATVLQRRVPSDVFWLHGTSVQVQDKVLCVCEATPGRSVELVFVSDIECRAWAEVLGQAITDTENETIALVDSVQVHGQDIRVRSVTAVMDRARGSTIVPPPPPVTSADHTFENDIGGRAAAVSIAPPPPPMDESEEEEGNDFVPPPPTRPYSYSLAAAPPPPSAVAQTGNKASSTIPEEEEEERKEDAKENAGDNDAFDARAFVLNLNSAEAKASRQIRMSLPTLRNSILRMSVNGVVIDGGHKPDGSNVDAKKTGAVVVPIEQPAFKIPARLHTPPTGRAGAGWTCNCGTRNRADAKRCVTCRTHLTAALVGKGNAWKCPCGLENFPGSETCASCGGTSVPAVTRDASDDDADDGAGQPSPVTVASTQEEVTPPGENTTANKNGEEAKDQGRKVEQKAAEAAIDALPVDMDEDMLAGRKRWVPDDTYSTCQQCNIAFSTTTRKHHCRACGSLFCGKCTTHFEMLGAVPERSRVCDRCYIAILSSGVRPEPVRPPSTSFLAFSSKG